MNYETALTELLVRRAQPGGERVLDWLVYGRWCAGITAAGRA
jgi:hypothetical protein